MDFTTNYCGPYWSAGKIQKSVISRVQPVNALDAACKAHDADYATAKSYHDLQLADLRFYQRLKRIRGVRARVYGPIVYYGNKIFRQVKTQPVYMGGYREPSNSVRSPFVDQGVTRSVAAHPIDDCTGARNDDTCYTAEEVKLRPEEKIRAVVDPYEEMNDPGRIAWVQTDLAGNVQDSNLKHSQADIDSNVYDEKDWIDHLKPQPGVNPFTSPW